MSSTVPNLGQLQLEGCGEGGKAQTAVFLHPVAVEHLEAVVSVEGEAQIPGHVQQSQVAHQGMGNTQLFAHGELLV